jgi:DNA-binding NarL/FixJ family response regulator
MRAMRVLVYDARELVASSVMALLRDTADVTSTARVSTAEEIELRGASAELLVIGVITEQPNPALEILERARRLRRRPRILMLYDGAPTALIVRGLEFGADGACLLEADPQQFGAAISAVMDGDMSLPEGRVGEVVHGLASSAASARARRELLDRLTDRELQVLRLLASGQGVDRIAATLSLSPSTVRSHLRHAMAKLGVHNQLHAAAEARRLLGSLTDPST